MNYEILYAFSLATSALAISPGPDNIYVLMQCVTHGRKQGMSTVVGLISGCIVHTTLLAFGVSTIIKNNDALFFGIKLLGALYLLFLAYKVFKSDATLNLTNQKVDKKGNWQLVKQGFIMNVLNPKVTMFFLAFFPGFLFSNELSTVVQFYTLGFLFMGVSFVLFSAIALLSGFISDYITGNNTVAIFLKWMQIAVFIGITVFLLL